PRLAGAARLRYASQRAWERSDETWTGFAVGARSPAARMRRPYARRRRREGRGGVRGAAAVAAVDERVSPLRRGAGGDVPVLRRCAGPRAAADVRRRRRHERRALPGGQLGSEADEARAEPDLCTGRGRCGDGAAPADVLLS